MASTANKHWKIAERARTAPQLGWFHRYPARFHAEVLAQMFTGVKKRLGRAPRMVLDPFAGTGATLSYARQLGFNSTGMELTPLGVLIARVRLAPPQDLDHALLLAERLAKAEPKWGTHPISEDLVFWIGEKNACCLAYYLQAIQEVRDIKLQRWLRLAVSSALRPCSIWLAGSIKPQVNPSRDFSPIGPHFIRAARALKRDCELEAAANITDVTARIVQGDARRLPLDDDSVDAVVTSPPYWTMYDYFDVHRLTYLAFVWGRRRDAQIGRSSSIERDGVGFVPPRSMAWWYREAFRKEGTIYGRALREYFVSMQNQLAELWRAVEPGGVVAYAIANSFRSGRRFTLATAIAHLMRGQGFKDVSTAKRENSHRRILPAGRDTQTGRFSSEGADAGVEEVLIYARK